MTEAAKRFYEQLDYVATKGRFSGDNTKFDRQAILRHIVNSGLSEEENVYIAMRIGERLNELAKHTPDFSLPGQYSRKLIDPFN